MSETWQGVGSQRDESRGHSVVHVEEERLLDGKWKVALDWGNDLTLFSFFFVLICGLHEVTTCKRPVPLTQTSVQLSCEL